MNWIMNFIFLIGCYPVLLILYYMLKSVEENNTYCFGTTLNRELRKDEAVKEISREYLKRLKKCTIIMAIIPLPFFFIPYFSISMSLWMIWILAICFIPCAIFIPANRKIAELKQERGWNEDSAVSYADLKIASVPSKVNLLTFLPTLILSTIPVIIAFILFRGYGYEIFGWLVAAFGLCTYLFYVCAIWTDRQKITVICEDSDINVNFARAKKQVWKNYWTVCAWFNTIFTWVMLLFMWRRELAFGGIIWGSVIYGVAVLGVTMWFAKKLLEINRVYEAKRTIVDAADDDRNWLWGMVYYNKNDKHYMIESRLGTGTTVNLGNKAGMITTVLGYAALLIIPIMCIWIIMLEFTPIHAGVENGVIVCEHLSVEYEIPLAEIDEYSILTELPRMTKVNGNGMDNVYSGTFEIFREGMLETFLNPQNNLFIKLKVDEQVYYISGGNDEETKALLKEIEIAIK